LSPKKTKRERKKKTVGIGSPTASFFASFRFSRRLSRIESPYKTGTNMTEEEDKDKRKKKKSTKSILSDPTHNDSSNALSLVHIHTQKIERERERELHLRRDWKLT
jgi:hypothetical protein